MRRTSRQGSDCHQESRTDIVQPVRRHCGLVCLLWWFQLVGGYLDLTLLSGSANKTKGANRDGTIQLAHPRTSTSRCCSRKLCREHCEMRRLVNPSRQPVIASISSQLRLLWFKVFTKAPCRRGPCWPREILVSEPRSALDSARTPTCSRLPCFSNRG